MFVYKRFISFLMIFNMIIIYSIFPVITVSASSETDPMSGFVMLKYIFTQVGAVFSGSMDDMIKNSETFQKYNDGEIPHTDDGKGNITVSGDVINNIYNELKDQLPALDGYYLLTPQINFDEWFYSIPDANISFYKTLTDFINNECGGFSFKYRDTGSVTYFYSCPGASYLVGQSGDYIKAYYDSLSLISSFTNYYILGNYINYGGKHTLQFDDFINSYIGPSTTKLFYTETDLKRYVMGGSKVFPTSNFMNFNPLKDNKLTFNKNEVEKQDWDKISNQIAETIKESLKDFSGTEEERQIIIDSKYDEILGALGDIGGGIDNVNNNLNSWLSRIYNKVATITIAITKFDLTKYFDKVNENLVNITDAVKNIKVSGGGGTGALIGGILGGLVSGLLDKIIGGEEDAEDVATQLLNVFTPMVNVSKTKFPFSLPWDTYAVVATLATTPETPKFDIPIEISSMGIKEHFVIDMKDFETLSKLARAFFALTFLLILINLTLKFVDKGGFD